MLRKFALVILAVSYAERGQPVADPRLCLAWWLARRLGLGWWLGLARWMGPRMASWMGTCLGTWMGMAPGWGWGGPRFVVAPGFYGGGCVVRRVVRGPWGPRRILVNRCW